MNCPPAMTHRTVEALCQRSRDISLEKGWLNPDGTDPRPLYTVIALFHTELSEAFEEIRNNKPLNEVYYEVKFKESDGSTTKQIVSSADIEAARKVEGKYGRGRDFLDAKPCGFPIELADYAIRIAQYFGSALKGAELERFTSDTVQVESDNAEKFIAYLHADCSRALSGPGVPTTLAHCMGTSLSKVFSFCEKNDIDIWAAIDEKEAYNRTRPVRHGGKKM